MCIVFLIPLGNKNDYQKDKTTYGNAQNEITYEMTAYIDIFE